MTPETIKAATSFADTINAGGGTNIDEALKAALGMLADDKRPSYVLFLTDGVPTVGERSERKIVVELAEFRSKSTRESSRWESASTRMAVCSTACRGNSTGNRYTCDPTRTSRPTSRRLPSSIGSPVLTNVDVKFEFDKPQTDAATDDHPDLSAKAHRSVRGRAARLGRPLSRTGPGQAHAFGRSGREATDIHAGGELRGAFGSRRQRLRRKGLGDAAHRGADR